MGTAANPGTGILIIHNGGNAELRNVSGYFEGLIIADRIDKFVGTTDVRGGVVLGAQSSNLTGGGGAEIRYSSAILAALLPLLPGTPAVGTAYTIASWEDDQNG